MKPGPYGYGPFPYSPIIDRPKLEWPNGAHVALWVIPNLEYFSMEERPGGYGMDFGRGQRNRLAQRIADRHGLSLVDAWPMAMIGYDCFVMAVPPGRWLT